MWTPTCGWNRSFSEKDKIQCIDIFLSLVKKGCVEEIAEIIAHMVLFKQKYGIMYSEEQEEQINALITW